MFLAGGCDDGSGKLEELKAKMCACKDVACVAAASADLEKLQGEIKDTKGNQKLLGEITACITSAAMGGAVAPTE